MCGILYVKSRNPVDPSTHDSAVALLKRRGPDMILQYEDHSVYAAQSVLHITGNREFYHSSRNDFFAYNGEVYNYLDFGSFGNDTELVYQAVCTDKTLFKKFNGPWSWIYVNGDSVEFASDPQGERCLYYYRDSDWLIVASEVAVILNYIQPNQQILEYTNKGWSLIDETPWQGIQRCEPGRLYRNGLSDIQLDSVWDWIDNPLVIDETEAQQELVKLMSAAVDRMRPNCGTTVSYSAGLDSNIIMNLLGDCELLAVDVTDKDPVVVRAREFLTVDELKRFSSITITPEQWAQEYRNMLDYTQMPVHWSHVGKWIVARNSKNPVIFTGLAADELFGGYDFYQTIRYDQSRSHSPFSSNDHSKIWHKCLNSYNGAAEPATLLMDYWYQVVGVDAPGQDRAAGAWGKETRNPFMDRSIMQFVLNLPWQLRTNCKPLVRHLFRRRWDQTLELPKMGFAGHANDSLPWLMTSIEPTGDRLADWKQIARNTFYEYTKK